MAFPPVRHETCVSQRIHPETDCQVGLWCHRMARVRVGSTGRGDPIQRRW